VTASNGELGSADAQVVVSDAPSGEVLYLRLGDDRNLVWSARSDALTYNLYRTDLGGLVDSDHDGAADAYGTCLQTGLASPSAVDPGKPPLGDGFGYLVTVVRAGGEGPLGFASSGAPRPNPDPCP